MENGFLEFLRRVRAGDPEAAAALVRDYEPVIRREARLRLTDPRLLRLSARRLWELWRQGRPPDLAAFLDDAGGLTAVGWGKARSQESAKPRRLPGFPWPLTPVS
jgi:hypothetical protein